MKISPLKAIKIKCKEDCCNNDIKSWKECEVTDCVLWQFRFGKNPNSKRKGNPNNLKAYRNRTPKNSRVTINDTNKPVN